MTTTRPRTARIAALVFSLALFGAACGSDDEAGGTDDGATTTTGAPGDSSRLGVESDAPEIDPSAYEGLTAEDAEAKAETDGVEYRVVREDDTDFEVTMDARTDRVNVEIDDGVVTSATVG